MTNLGDARIEVTVEFSQAIANLNALSSAFGDFAEAVETALGDIDIDPELVRLKAFSSTIAAMDRELAQFNATAKQFELTEEVQQAIDAFQELRDELAGAELGPARVNRGEEEALQRALFLQQTQAASELASAKARAFEESAAAARKAAAEERELQESLFKLKTQHAAEEAEAKARAYEEGLAAARAAIGEERALQEALFLLQTRGAHEAAEARQRAFEQAPQTARDEEEVQRALFLAITQGAHEAALAKQEAFDQAAAAAERAVGEERTLQEALFLLQTQGAHEGALAKEQAYEAGLNAAKAALGEERALQESLFLLQTQQAHEAAQAKEELLEISKRAAKEERELQEALFLQATQEAADIADAKRKAFEEQSTAATAAPVDAIRAQAQEVNKLNQEIANTRKEFLAAFGEIPPQGAASIKALEDRVKALGGTLPQIPQGLKGIEAEFDRLTGLIEANNQEINRFRRNLGSGLPTVLQDHIGRLSAENRKLEKEIASLGGGGAPKGLQRFSQFFGNAIDSASTKLASFGLNIRDVGIVLGAGFLSGGIALIARSVLQMAAALAKALLEMAKFGAALLTLRDQVNAIFGESSATIREFATGAAESMGLAEDAALRLTGQIGLLFQSFGVTEERSADFALGLAQAAEVFHRVAPAAGTFEDTLRDLQQAMSGNLEVLRKYGVQVGETDQVLRETARRGGIKLQEGAIDSGTRALLAYMFIQQAASGQLDKYNKIGVTAATIQERLNASLTNLKGQLGTTLAPAFLAATQAITFFVQKIQDAVEEIKKYLKENPALVDTIKDLFTALKGLSELAFDNFIDQLKTAGDIVQRNFGPLLSALKALEHVLPGNALGFEATGDAAEEAGKKEQTAGEKAKEFAENQRKAAEEARAIQKAYVATAEDLEKLVDAYEKVNRAVADNERAVNQAEINLARAREDAANSAEDAQRNLTDAYRDRNRAIFDANERIADAEKDNLRAIADAEDRLSDAHTEAFRAIRDAEERLSDERIDSTRRVRDAEEDLFKARQQRQDAILDAQLSVEAALRKGDLEAFNRANLELTQARRKDELREAEKKLAEETADSQKALARLERDLAETRKDAREKVAEAEENLRRVVEDAADKMADAQRNLQRVIEDSSEKIEKAKRDLHRVEIELSRKLFDAQKAVEEQTRRGEQAIKDAKAELDKLNAQFNTTDLTLAQILDKLERIKNTVAGAAGSGFTGGGGGFEEGREGERHGASGSFDEEDDRGFFARIGGFIGDVFGGAASAIGNILGELGVQIGNLAEVMSTLAGRIGTLIGLIAGGRAVGGRVVGGTAVLVGEKGPELFVPDANGFVLSNSQLEKLLSNRLSDDINRPRLKLDNKTLQTFSDWEEFRRLVRLLIAQQGDDERNKILRGQIIVNQVANDPEATAFAVASRLVRGVG